MGTIEATRLGAGFNTRPTLYDPPRPASVLQQAQDFPKAIARLSQELYGRYLLSFVSPVEEQGGYPHDLVGVKVTSAVIEPRQDALAVSEAKSGENDRSVDDAVVAQLMRFSEAVLAGNGRRQNRSSAPRSPPRRPQLLPQVVLKPLLISPAAWQVSPACWRRHRADVNPRLQEEAESTPSSTCRTLRPCATSTFPRVARLPGLGALTTALVHGYAVDLRLRSVVRERHPVEIRTSPPLVSLPSDKSFSSYEQAHRASRRRFSTIQSLESRRCSTLFEVSIHSDQSRFSITA